jgi:hypothetical protein
MAHEARYHLQERASRRAEPVWTGRRDEMRPRCLALVSVLFAVSWFIVGCDDQPRVIPRDESTDIDSHFISIVRAYSVYDAAVKEDAVAKLTSLQGRYKSEDAKRILDTALTLWTHDGAHQNAVMLGGGRAFFFHRGAVPAVSRPMLIYYLEYGRALLALQRDAAAAHRILSAIPREGLPSGEIEMLDLAIADAQGKRD